MGTLDWARPGWALAFLLPLLLWLLLRLRHRPPSVVTGTWKLWREVAREAPKSAPVLKRGTPPWVWFCVASLLSGALALTGPRALSVEPPRVVTLVVDPSPSMDLPLDEARSLTRRHRALELAALWVEEELEPEDLVRWVVPGIGVSGSGRTSPLEVQRSRPLAKEPDWRLYDRPGTLLVTDGVPRLSLEHAGYAASGGRAVHGTVAIVGQDRVEWDRSGGRVIEGGAPAMELVIEHEPGHAVPEVLERMIGVWAAIHGITVNHGQIESEASTVLRLSFETPTETRVHDIRHEGWSTRLRGGGLTPEPVTEGLNWLVAPSGAGDEGEPTVLVRARPGHIRLGITAFDEPTGDPARFALSLGRLFDRYRRPPEGVVALEEREDAGPEAFRAPLAIPSAPRGKDAVPPHLKAGEIDAWLAGLAGVLALVAVSIRRQ